MNDTIYSANLWQVFSSSILGILFFFLIASAGWLFLRGEKKPRADIPLIAAVTLLSLTGVIMAATTVYSFTLGSKTLIGRLSEKTEFTSNTGRGTDARHYRLYFGTQNAFELADKGAFDKMIQGECYQITAYPNLAPLALISQSETGTSVTGLVAEIKLADPKNCLTSQ